MNRALMAMLSTHLCVAIATNAVTTSPYVCCTQAQQTTAEQKVCGVSNNAIINSSLTTAWSSSQDARLAKALPELSASTGQSKWSVSGYCTARVRVSERAHREADGEALEDGVHQDAEHDEDRRHQVPSEPAGAAARLAHAGSQVWAADRCDGVLRSNSGRCRRPFADL